MHTARIEPYEERLLFPVRAIDEVDRSLEELLVDRLHSFLSEWPRVLAFLLAPRTKAGIVTGSIGGGRDALHDTTRTELRHDVRIFRIIGVFRLIFGVQVIEIAEERV